MRHSMNVKKNQIWLLLGAVLAASVLSTVSLLEFYVQNANKIDGPTRVIHYVKVTLMIVVLVTAFVKVCRLRLPLWRAILAVGIGAFVFFSYYRFEPLRTALPADWKEWLPLLWALASLMAAMIALIFIRRPAAVSIVLIPSLAIATPSIAQAVALVIQRNEARPTPEQPSVIARRALISPNIYWIVLDGYPRRDVLRDSFGFDNTRFLNSLTSLGFTVLEQSFSNFPASINSVSSTLNMDYTIRSEGEAVRPFTLPDMYPIVKGKSRTVSSLKALGYNYVHFENGYDYLTKCGEDEQRCVRGNESLDEQDIAILSNTPIIHLITEFATTNTQSTFHIGGISDLSAKLDVIQETPAPFFLYAHVLAPHPPIRFRADCSMRPAEPDLVTWSAKARPDFIEQLKCVNTQAEDLLRRIDQSDPNAIVILQSDHGTAFNGQFGKKMSDWTDADLRERFGVLNAMRLPASCSRSIVADLTLVDTFPLVLSCLTGDEFKRHPGRFFVTPYDNSDEFGQAVEYASNRLQKAPELRMP
jgi:hypothetical protein